MLKGERQKQAELESKYAAVFALMKELGIEVERIAMKGPKLYILARAATHEARGKLWEQLRDTDPKRSELLIDVVLAGEPRADQAAGLAGLPQTWKST